MEKREEAKTTFRL
ncbi:hypothetical protein L5515_004160 [Caenorhabditis briggsae]|uniref:Uncharacterized protein n=1 Tax=Caenorhabditis briggsae TaxID=6238 RepID=A0AAE9JBH7_CAEBR|nr:hypothetical protein L5515_004160 [Caenorhabditis briggsae]